MDGRMAQEGDEARQAVVPDAKFGLRSRLEAEEARRGEGEH